MTISYNPTTMEYTLYSQCNRCRTTVYLKGYNEELIKQELEKDLKSFGWKCLESGLICPVCAKKDKLRIEIRKLERLVDELESEIEIDLVKNTVRSLVELFGDQANPCKRFYTSKIRYYLDAFDSQF